MSLRIKLKSTLWLKSWNLIQVKCAFVPFFLRAPNSKSKINKKLFTIWPKNIKDSKPELRMEKEDTFWLSWSDIWEISVSSIISLPNHLKPLFLGKMFQKCAMQSATELKAIARNWASKRNHLFHSELHRYWSLLFKGLWHRCMCLHLFWLYLPRLEWSSRSLLTNRGFCQRRNHEARWMHFPSPRRRKVKKEIFGQ